MSFSPLAAWSAVDGPTVEPGAQDPESVDSTMLAYGMHDKGPGGKCCKIHSHLVCSPWQPANPRAVHAARRSRERRIRVPPGAQLAGL